MSATEQNRNRKTPKWLDSLFEKLRTRLHRVRALAERALSSESAETDRKRSLRVTLVTMAVTLVICVLVGVLALRGAHTDAVMLYVGDTAVGYIHASDVSVAEESYRALCAELGKSEETLTFGKRKQIAVSSKTPVFDGETVKDALCAYMTEGMTRGYLIQSKRGDTVLYVLSLADVKAAGADAVAYLEEKIASSAQLGDTPVTVTVKEAYTPTPAWVPDGEFPDRAALYEAFCADTNGDYGFYNITVSYKENEVELIPYEIEYVENDAQFDGVTTMLSPGTCGTETVTYTVTLDYLTGEVLSRTEIARNVTKKPVNAVSYEGNHVLPDGISTGTLHWPLPSIPDDDPPLDENGEPDIPENTLALKNTYVSSGWGDRDLWGSPDFHLGYDIVAPVYTEVYAADGGIVVFASYTASYGYTVRIKHENDLETLYAHQAKLAVNVGDVVKQGDVIGYVGSSGTTSGVHLHFEVRYKHVTTDPGEYIKIPEEVYIYEG